MKLKCSTFTVLLHSSAQQSNSVNIYCQLINKSAVQHDAKKHWRREEMGVTEWDGWTASSTRWTWTRAGSGRWLWTGKPGVLRSMGRRVRHDIIATEQQLTTYKLRVMFYSVRIFTTSSPGDRISSNPERTVLRVWGAGRGGGIGLSRSLQQRAR